MTDTTDEITVSAPPPFRPLMYFHQHQWASTAPPEVLPTPDFVFEVRRELEKGADDPEAVATRIVEWIEEYGSQGARPVFDMEGNGPFCSWCGALGPICSHGRTGGQA